MRKTWLLNMAGDPVALENLRIRIERHSIPEPNSGCWLWIGASDGRGYGQLATERGASPVKAHRASLMAFKSELGEDTDHLCRQPSCVNPAHLQAVSHRVNCLRGHSPNAINARKTHCALGHEFTPGNTYSPPSRPKSRQCLVCHQQWVTGRQMAGYYTKAAREARRSA